MDLARVVVEDAELGVLGVLLPHTVLALLLGVVAVHIGIIAVVVAAVVEHAVVLAAAAGLIVCTAVARGGNRLGGLAEAVPLVGVVAAALVAMDLTADVPDDASVLGAGRLVREA